MPTLIMGAYADNVTHTHTYIYANEVEDVHANIIPVLLRYCVCVRVFVHYMQLNIRCNVIQP
jgi:hypothetical protein